MDIKQIQIQILQVFNLSHRVKATGAVVENDAGAWAWAAMVAWFRMCLPWFGHFIFYFSLKPQLLWEYFGLVHRLFSCKYATL